VLCIVDFSTFNIFATNFIIADLAHADSIGGGSKSDLM
jgi:hypothetical protein